MSVILTSLVAGRDLRQIPLSWPHVAVLAILATAIVPFESYMIPLYLQLVAIKWINTYQGIILPTLFMSFGIFLLRQHIASAIPTELLEAGRVDGASEWWILARVIAPLAVPAHERHRHLRLHPGLGRLRLAADGRQQPKPLQHGAWADRLPVPLLTDYGKLMAGSVISVLPDAGNVSHPAPADHRQRGAHRREGLSHGAKPR